MKRASNLGGPVFGLGVVWLGAVGLAFRDFVGGQAAPAAFPARVALVYGAAVFLMVTGAATVWRRTAAWGAGALALYYGIVVILLMNGRELLAQYRVYGAYSDLAEQVGVALGAYLLWVGAIDPPPSRSARLAGVAQKAFGVCALLYGGAHFVYMNLTAPLVPRWLPPSQPFWGYATGVCFLAAGLALLTGVRARLAALLLTAMLFVFAVLVHLRMLLAAPGNEFLWSENALNLTLAGAAWVVADSCPRRAGERAPAPSARLAPDQA